MIAIRPATGRKETAVSEYLMEFNIRPRMGYTEVISVIWLCEMGHQWFDRQCHQKNGESSRGQLSVSFYFAKYFGGIQMQLTLGFYAIVTVCVDWYLKVGYSGTSKSNFTNSTQQYFIPEFASDL